MNHPFPYNPQVIPSEEAFSHIPPKTERMYDRFLSALYFSPSLKGYSYIKQALYYEQRHRHLLPSLNKDIYEEISRCYQTEISAVERCITFSVQRAYQQNPKRFRPLFPDCQKAPSNFRFIKTVALHLLTEEI